MQIAFVSRGRTSVCGKQATDRAHVHALSGDPFHPPRSLARGRSRVGRRRGCWAVVVLAAAGRVAGAGRDGQQGKQRGEGQQGGCRCARGGRPFTRRAVRDGVQARHRAGEQPRQGQEAARQGGQRGRSRRRGGRLCQQGARGAAMLLQRPSCAARTARSMYYAPARAPKSAQAPVRAGGGGGGLAAATQDMPPKLAFCRAPFA